MSGFTHTYATPPFCHVEILVKFEIKYLSVLCGQPSEPEKIHSWSISYACRATVSQGPVGRGYEEK